MRGRASPLVSVIVAAYNSGRWIERTLDSALQQTCSDIEVIVVDDGSTDVTASIVERMARDDPRLHLIRQSNGGASSARNAGLVRARGAFLAPLDADDLWHPTKLQRQLDCFAVASPDTGVVYCYFASVDEDDDVIFPRKIYHAPTGHIFPQLTVANVVGNGSSPLIRREDLARIGSYDEAFKDGCEDHDLYLRLAEQCRYDLVPEFLVGYRRSRGSLSMDIARNERAIAQVTAAIVSRHPDLPRRLLRWRDGNMYRYLALHARMGLDRRRSLVLSMRSVLSDPWLLCDWIVTRAKKGRHRTGGVDSPRRVNFYDIDPRPGSGERFEPTALDVRRQRATARMRFEQTTAPWSVSAPR